MITKVSGFNPNGVTRDSHKHAQGIPFKNTSYTPIQAGDTAKFSEQKDKGVLASTSIVVGSILFTIAYFMITALALNLKK